MGSLTTTEQDCVERAAAEPMLAQVEAWAAINSGSVKLLPVGFNVDAYQTIFASSALVRGFGNSLFYSLFGAVFGTALTVLAGYPNAKQLYWVQEEPQNMGGWTFMEPRLRRLVPDGDGPTYIGRDAAASPATGSYKVHNAEEAEFVARALAR